MLECGTAEAIITPDSPVRMAGYADRVSAYDGKYEDIFLKAVYLRDDASGIRFAVISADLIWWNPEMFSLLGPRLREAGYNEDEVVFTATHSHSGPGTGNAFIPLLEDGDASYMEKLADAAVSALEEAAGNAEPVTMKAGCADAPLNADRRTIAAGIVEMKPDYGKTPDRTMTVLSFWRADGSLKAAAVHYACHANLAHENIMQRDYPGILEDYIEKEYPGSMAIFLQGATGDMRPNSVLGDRFVPASRSGVIAFGEEAGRFAAEAIRNSRPCEGALGGISVSERAIPVVHDYSVPLDDETRSQWMEWLGKKGFPDSETLRAKHIEAGGIHLVFVNSEIVRSYAAFARSIRPGALLSGYSDGMIGYIPDDKQIEEGGYEPVGSAPYFAIAGRFASGTEGIVKELIKEALS